MKNLPNILTVGRLFLTVAFIYCLLHAGMAAMVMAIALFVIASLTDFYDGYLAKKYNLISDFGKIMDPIADKFLVLAAFFIFERMRIIAPWIFLAIFLREVTVTGSRLAAVRKGRVLAAEQAGKYKTSLQLLAIFVILVFLTLEVSAVGAGWSADTRDAWRHVIDMLMLLTVALTVISGISYFWNNRKVILLRA